MEGVAKKTQELDFQKFLQLNFSFAPSRVLTTALQLRVFSHIAQGKTSAAAIARAADSSERGMAMLLDALVGLELLSKKDGVYSLSSMSERYLVRESPDYVGFNMESEALWNSWGRLTECVRTGRPTSSVNQQDRAEDFFPQLVRGLHVVNREPARRLTEALTAGNGRTGLRVLDVACGSGVWGIAIAEADREARVTALDFPAVLNLTRRFAEQHGVAPRFDFLAADLKHAPLGESRFDLALLGNIVHSEGETSSRDLFRRLYKALRPGGRVAVIDMIPADDRSGPVFALMFAINMLVNTDEGSTYTIAEYTAWLSQAGFARVEPVDIGSHSPAIVATRD